MDSDALEEYTPLTYPAIEGGEASYITDELLKLSGVIDLLISVLKKLEVRIEALEP